MHIELTKCNRQGRMQVQLRLFDDSQLRCLGVERSNQNGDNLGNPDTDISRERLQSGEIIYEVDTPGGVGCSGMFSLKVRN